MIFPEVKKLKKSLNDSMDIVVRELSCGEREINIIYIKSMLNEDLFVSGVLGPLIDFGSSLSEYSADKKFSLDNLINEVLKTIDIEKIDKKDALKNMCENKAILFLKGERKALAIDMIKFPTRTPEEPPTSAVLKGPREGFVEDIKTNISLLRRRFSNEKLVIKEQKIGKCSQTKVAIVYVQGVADKKLVKQVQNKLGAIDIDGIIDSYYLTSFLQSEKGSMFKQVGSCEKPDIVSAKILEGRIAILVDNTPIVLTVPFIFLEDLQNSNDYYSLDQYASYIRFIRLLGLVFAVLIPGAYIAIRLYHYNVVPLSFFITIANATTAIPLTPFLEIVFVLILFEVLYEVSLRLPRYLGLATSIVGALILGDTGVKAGLISPPGVMVIALSIIAVYTIPDQVDQINLLRAVFIVLGGGLGLFGIIAGFIFIIAYLNNLENFNVAYLAPYSPRIRQDLKDGVIKRNITGMKTRPKSLHNKNKVRLKDGKNS
ncbi:MAG: spore germination protein [Firmicutes bacterium]|nr:spore germination protein [Bacillota bacterium]MDY3659269.1 spore germination protein [Eubacteriales bacterium]